MATPIFPISSLNKGLMWGVHKRPMFQTAIQKSASGKETRVPRWSYPVWNFELSWELLRDDRAVAANLVPSSPYHELRTFMGFFLLRLGAFEPFFLKDDTDNLLDNQQIGIGNGSAVDFQVMRSLGGFVEPVGGVDATMEIRVNGTPVSYTANTPADGFIRLAVAAGNGLAVTAHGLFYFKVRFPDDLDFEAFNTAFWQLRRVPLTSVKAWESGG